MKKIKFLLVPFVLLALANAVVLGVLRMGMDMMLGVDMNVHLWRFWFPGILALAFWYFFLRKRIKVFEIPDKRGNGYMNTHMFSILILALPALAFQFFLEKGFTETIRISSVNEIDPDKKYVSYQITDPPYLKDALHVNMMSEVTGRHNETLHYYFYGAVPLSSQKELNVLLWAGHRFDKSFSNRSTDQQKQYEWDELYNRSMNDMDRILNRRRVYLNRVPNNGDYREYLNAIHRTPENESRSHIIFEIAEESVAGNSILALRWFMASLIVAIFFPLIISWSFKLNKNRLKAFNSGKSALSGDDIEMRKFMTFQTDSKGSAAILYLNLLVMIWMIATGMNPFSPNAHDLLEIGGLRGAEVQQGEYWRLVSHQFLHAGVMHLANNMVMIVLFGAMIEQAMSTWKYLVLYLLTGIIAGIGSMMYHPDVVGVGASGALFGILGWHLFEAFFGKKNSPSAGMFQIILFLAGLNIVFGFLIPGVDNVAHITGLFAGFVLGAIFRPDKAKK